MAMDGSGSTYVGMSSRISLQRLFPNVKNIYEKKPAHHKSVSILDKNHGREMQTANVTILIFIGWANNLINLNVNVGLLCVFTVEWYGFLL